MKKTVVCTLFLCLSLLSWIGLFAQEKPKRPAIDSFREFTESWSRYRDDGPPLPEGITGQYLKMRISAAPLDKPLLKYRMNVYSTELESGNAAVLYSEALNELDRAYQNSLRKVYESEEYRKLDPQKDANTISKMKFKAFPLYPYWSDDVHDEIDSNSENEMYANLQKVFELSEKASRRNVCDWSHVFEFRGIMTDLEHIQRTRSLARYLGGKANWEIRNGNYSEAVKTIRVGLRLGSHTRKSFPSSGLVTSLVGLAIEGIMLNELTLLSTQADAPNLYPALTQLDMEPKNILYALNAEQRYVFNLIFPMNLEILDDASTEECKAMLRDIIEAFAEYGGGNAMKEDSGRSLAEMYVCLSAYPLGKERLLELGKTETEIESLSVYQIAVPFIFEELRNAYEQMYVLAALANGESHTEIRNTFDGPLDYTNPANMVIGLLMPAFEAAKTAHYRQQQTLERLKIVHAIRLHARKNGGELPDSLEDIKVVPVPKIDPISGKPFVYKRNGNTASVDYMTYAPSRMDIILEP